MQGQKEQDDDCNCNNCKDKGCSQSKLRLLGKELASNGSLWGELNLSGRNRHKFVDLQDCYEEDLFSVEG